MATPEGATPFSSPVIDTYEALFSSKLSAGEVTVVGNGEVVEGINANGQVIIIMRPTLAAEDSVSPTVIETVGRFYTVVIRGESNGSKEGLNIAIADLRGPVLLSDTYQIVRDIPLDEELLRLLTPVVT